VGTAAVLMSTRVAANTLKFDVILIFIGAETLSHPATVAYGRGGGVGRGEDGGGKGVM
jgi:hypothetical protein